MRRSDVTQVYSEHGEELQRYLTRRVDCAQTAADLTQEAFVRLMKAQPSERLENPRAYLFRIASNLVADHFRGARATPRKADSSALEALADRAPGPERTLMARDEVRRLESAIDELPQRQREILLLHKFEGLSYAAIAERLGISKNTVMVHMMRALAHCRDRLADK